MELVVTSTAFEHNGFMPIQYTGYGEDISPPLTLSGLVPNTKSIVVIMVDLDIPFVSQYPHWLIWNIPVMATIPEALPRGESPSGLKGVKQGLAYGKHQYKGPKPPKIIRNRHRYVFTVYALDAVLDIDAKAKKRDLLAAMQGHILQQASITGIYKNN